MTLRSLPVCCCRSLLPKYDLSCHFQLPTSSNAAPASSSIISYRLSPSLPFSSFPSFFSTFSAFPLFPSLFSTFSSLSSFTSPFFYSFPFFPSFALSSLPSPPSPSFLNLHLFHLFPLLSYALPFPKTGTTWRCVSACRCSSPSA